MKTSTMKLTGKVALALLLSTSPVFGNDTTQDVNETEKTCELKQEAGWSTRKKIGVGTVVAITLGGGAYATHRYNPKLIGSLTESMRTAGNLVGDKAVIVKNYVTDTTRSLLGYDPQPRDMMGYARSYKLKAYRTLGFLPQPVSLKQRAMRSAAVAYAKAAPVMSMVKDVTFSTAKNHPYVLVAGSMAVPSTYAGRGLYVSYNKSSDQVSSEEVVVVPVIAPKLVAPVKAVVAAPKKAAPKAKTSSRRGCPNGMCSLSNRGRAGSRKRVSKNRNTRNRNTRRTGRGTTLFSCYKGRLV